MQNRYTGDIGDFGKLGLLRILQSEGFTIGVNWYLVPNEDHNNDGQYVQYLTNGNYTLCDRELWRELKCIIDSGKREVSVLQNDRILKATFFSWILDFAGIGKADRREIRENWHINAMRTLSETDIIFVDPDNGVMVRSAEGTRRENKYVKPDELADYYENGSSVIYYQHKARRQDLFYVEQHRKILHQFGLNEHNGMALKFRTTSQRYYFFIMQPCHIGAIKGAVGGMMKTEWKNHFSVL